MTGIIPKENLTTYRRWEITDFDDKKIPVASEPVKEQEPPEPPPEPAPAPGIVETELPPIESPVVEESLPHDEPVVLPTAADIERMYAEAHQQGYSAGYDEGITTARDVFSRIEGLMTELQQALSELDQHIADQLLATSVEISRQVIRQSLRIKPDLLISIVKEAVTALHPRHESPTLIVHPDDARMLRDHFGNAPESREWRIVENASITPGGCRIELGSAEVDATLETRWRRAIESIGINQEWLDNQP